MILKNFEPVTRDIVKKFTEDEPSCTYFRKYHNTLTPFKFYSIVSPRNLITRAKVCIFDLLAVNSDDLPITKEEKKDLQDMLK